MRSETFSFLQPGRNCWRVEHADRFSMLVDAEPYFRAVRAAVRVARHSVFILAWDIDSRMHLVPGGANDGHPDALGEFLMSVLEERPELRIYVLNWDFAMLYAMEREWSSVSKMGWENGRGRHRNRRLAFHMDGLHPVGASHHQKVVVVDDSLAFVGGLDLTRSRWDTPAHASDEPLRTDTDGKPYGPFHDVQAMVDGPLAAALGDLARARWQRATGEKPVGRCPHRADPWPLEFEPDITDIGVAISRTEPAYEGEAGVHEIRQLHLDAIAGASGHLFFENQYFTSGLIANAMSERLAEADGPEVVVISPQCQSGWLEEATMGVLRARMQRRLKAADRYGRYRLLCPVLPGLKSGCLNVHSKVFTMDDRLFSVGSANLSNRSMAADTECNLSFEANGPPEEAERIAGAIARLRNRLLAEHLGSTVERVAAETCMHGSLAGAIKALYGGSRTLETLDPVTTPELDALIPERALFDPERPIQPNELVAQFVPKDAREPVPRRLIGLGVLAVGLILMAVAWRWTPLREWVNLESLIVFASTLEELPLTPLAVVAGYVIAGLVMLPVTVLIAVTGIVFGPVWGAGYAIAGTLLSAATSYGVGRWLGRETVRRLLGPRLNRLSRRIAKRGILAIMVVRVLPVAPFTVVNMVAGASQISFRDFMLGTLFGMTPGILLTVTFVHHLAEAVRNPSPGTVAVLALMVALVIGFAFLLQRLLGRKDDAGAV